MNVMRQILFNVIIKPSKTHQAFAHSKPKLTTNTRINLKVFEELLRPLVLSSDAVGSLPNDLVEMNFTKPNTLSDLSDAEFVTFLGHFAKNHSNYNAKENASKADNSRIELVKNECTHRLLTFDKANRFHCAHILLKYNFFFNYYMLNFNKLLVCLWSQMIEDKGDFVTFLSLLNKSTMVNDTGLFENLEDFFSTNITSFSPVEVSFVCFVFFGSNNRMKNMTTVNALKDFTFTHLDSFSLLHLLNVFKVLRHASFTDVQFFTKITPKLITKCKTSSTNLTQLAQLAFTYASLKIHNPQLFKGLSEVLNCNLQNSKVSFRFKDLVRLCWSYGQFNIDPPSQLIPLLISSFTHQVAAAYPEMAVEGLLALALLGHYPSSPYQIIFNPSFLNIKAARPLEQRFQLQILKTLEEIHIGNHKSDPAMEQFDPQNDLQRELLTRKGLLPLVDTMHLLIPDWSKFKTHFVLSCSRIADIELHTDQQGCLQAFNTSPPEPLFTTDRPSSKEISFQSESSESIMRKVLKKDIFQVFCSSVKYRDVIIPAKKESKKQTCKKFIIKVMGVHQYPINHHHLLSIHRVELDILNCMGYTVYVVNPYTAFQIETSNQRKEIVSNILKKLKIKLEGGG